jgi:hypothetical protein
VAVIVAAGVSNHGGVGTWRGVSGNSRFFGTEAECGGDSDWTAAQRAAYPKLNAAYCDLGGFGPDMIAGHNEYATPAGRKIDIRDWPMSAMRAQVAAILAGGTPAPVTPTPQETDLTPAESVMLKDILANVLAVRQQETQVILQHLHGYGRRIEHTEAEVVALRATMATLVEHRDDLTADEIEDAVAKALRENIVRVDVDVAGQPGT